jgi:predicted esterase
VAILGHSQGAAFSYITAVLNPGRVGSIFSYAGYFPDEYRTTQQLDALKKNGVRITLAHGSIDTTVDPEESKKLAALLAEHGILSTLTMYEDTGHNITRDVLQQMAQWLQGVKGN